MTQYLLGNRQSAIGIILLYRSIIWVCQKGYLCKWSSRLRASNLAISWDNQFICGTEAKIRLFLNIHHPKTIKKHFYRNIKVVCTDMAAHSNNICGRFSSRNPNGIICFCMWLDHCIWFCSFAFGTSTAYSACSLPSHTWLTKVIKWSLDLQSILCNYVAQEVTRGLSYTQLYWCLCA